MTTRSGGSAIPAARSTTIVEAVGRHAAATDRTALVWLDDGEGDERAWTYSDLDRRARGIAVELGGTAKPGDRALLVYPPGLDFIAAFMGCLYAGLLAVPTYPPSYRRGSRSAARFRAVVSDARPSVALTTADNLARTHWFAWREAGLGSLPWRATDAIDLARGGEWKDPGLAGGDPAFLQYTSGSTTSPRGVVLRHGNLVANLEAIAVTFGHTRDSLCVSWLPPFHDMGLVGCILQPLYVGFPVVLMDPLHFLRRPARWLRAIATHRATTSGGPDSAYALCARLVKDDDLAGIDLASWTVAFNGSETVRAATLERFAERFRGHGFRREAFFPCYGLAEASLLVSCGRVRDPPRIIEVDREALAQGRAEVMGVSPGRATASLVSCGAAVPGHEVAIVDPESGEGLPGGRVGEVWVRGPSVAGGYWNRAEETSATFTALRPGDDHPYLRTGDLGFLLGDELVVTGRRKDVLIVSGRNHSPEDIEMTVAASHGAIVPDGCAAFAVPIGDGDERLVVAAEIRREARKALAPAEVIAAVREAVGEAHDLALDAVVLLAAGTLPRTTSGKLRRGACRDAFRSGAWEPLGGGAPAPVPANGDGGANEPGPIPRSASPAVPLDRSVLAAASATERSVLVAAYLARRITDLAGVPPDALTPAATLSGLGIDSLLRLELVLAIEADLDLRLPLEEISAETPLGEVLRAVESRVAVAQAPPRQASEASAAEAEASPGRAFPGEEVPLTAVQRDLLATSSHPRRYGMVLFLRTAAGVDVATLEAAVSSLARRHDALRLRFVNDGARWRQSYDAHAPAAVFERTDASVASSRAARAELRDAVLERLAARIDLGHGPLLAASLLDRGADATGVLVLWCHHLVADAIALRVLLTSLRSGYRRAARGEDLDDRLETPTFGQWAGALAGVARSPGVRAELAYWSRMLPGARAEGGAVRGGGGKRALPRFVLEPVLAERFRRRFATAAEQHDALLAAFLHAHAATTGEGELTVELERHGRHPLAGLAPARTVGWCVIRFPLRIALTARDGVEAAHARVIAALAEVPRGGLGYGLLKHDEEGPGAATLRARGEPALGFSFRSRIDDPFRAGDELPVLDWHMDPCADDGRTHTLSLAAGTRGPELWWTLAHDQRCAPGVAGAVAAGLADALPRLV